jgi:hypothetical protein
LNHAAAAAWTPPLLECPDHWREFSTVRDLGKFIVIIGVITTLVGLIMWSGIAPKWLGRLPGDIRIERDHSSFYFPIVTCIIISIVLSLLLSLFSIFRR